MAKDYYHILGVDRTASQEAIKKAYRTLAHTHHPDKKGGDEARFKEINEAYSVLGDSDKRKQYDQFGSAYGQGGFGGQSTGGFGGFDFSQFNGQGFGFGGSQFEDLFTDMFMGRRQGSRDQRGDDIQVDVEVSFEEMVRGAKRDIRVRALLQCRTCQGTGGAPGSKEQECRTCHGKGQIQREVRTILGNFAQIATCESCHGRGKTYEASCSTCRGEGRVREERTIPITIPAGIEHEQVLSIANEGEAGVHGARSGDLLVVIRVRPHERFVRRGDDLVMELPLSYSQLVLGDRVDVPTLNGTVAMKIPAGTEPGEVFRIKGEGVPHLGRLGRGDQLVKVRLTVPKHPSKRERELLEALRETKE